MARRTRSRRQILSLNKEDENLESGVACQPFSLELGLAYTLPPGEPAMMSGALPVSLAAGTAAAMTTGPVAATDGGLPITR